MTGNCADKLTQPEFNNWADSLFQNEDNEKLCASFDHLWLHIVHVRLACARKGHSDGIHPTEVCCSTHLFQSIQTYLNFLISVSVCSRRPMYSRPVNYCCWQSWQTTHCFRYYFHTISSGSKPVSIWCISQSSCIVPTFCIAWGRGGNTWCRMSYFTPPASLDCSSLNNSCNLRWNWIRDYHSYRCYWPASIAASESPTSGWNIMWDSY